jgi:hypothetical protein
MRSLALGSILAAAAVLAGCSNTPSGPSVSFGAPAATAPGNAASFKFIDQPVTVSFANAFRTGTAAPTYTVEVATDPAFANKTVSTSGLAEGANGTTTYVLPSLPGGATYYWHSIATVDGVAGAASPMGQFKVAQQVVVSAPTTASPASGLTTASQQLTFVATNATRTGPAGPISYEFQLSNTSNFSSITASAVIPEQSDQTSWSPSGNLPAGTLFWRVRATDATDKITTAFSSASSFTIQPFDMRQATMWDNDPTIPTWAQTATITSVVFTDQAFDVDFDLRTGPNAWPESGAQTIQYTLGMCLNINDHWNCSAVVEFWTGRDLEASGIPSEVGETWFYNQRWGAMQGHQPQPGEIVGLFVTQGDNRGACPCSSLKERSNVLLMPWGGQYP